MPASWGLLQKGAPLDTGIYRRRDELHPRALMSGIWAGGTHCGHPQSPAPAASSSPIKGLGPPRENEILNLISKGGKPLHLPLQLTAQAEFGLSFTSSTGPSLGRVGRQLQHSCTP